MTVEDVLATLNRYYPESDDGYMRDADEQYVSVGGPLVLLSKLRDALAPYELVERPQDPPQKPLSLCMWCDAEAPPNRRICSECMTLFDDDDAD